MCTLICVCSTVYVSVCLQMEVSKGKNVDKFLSEEKWMVFMKSIELM